MKRVLSALTLYALSLVFSTGLFLAISVRGLAWIADPSSIPIPGSVQTQILLNSLSNIGVASFVFWVLFALLGLAIDRIGLLIRGVAEETPARTSN